MSALQADGLLASRVKPVAGVITVQLDGETVVYQPVRQSLTVLDPLGTVIWTLLDGTVAVDTLCHELADAYQAPLTQVQHDIAELVTKLVDDQLLESV